MHFQGRSVELCRRQKGQQGNIKGTDPLIIEPSVMSLVVLIIRTSKGNKKLFNYQMFDLSKVDKPKIPHGFFL